MDFTETPVTDQPQPVTTKITRGKHPVPSVPKRYEPSHKVIEEVKNLEIKAIAISDHPRYDCSLNSVQFKNTLMFQTRSFSLPFKNTCNSTLEVAWFIVASNEKDEDEEPPFSITPESSAVPPGETKVRG